VSTKGGEWKRTVEDRLCMSEPTDMEEVQPRTVMKNDDEGRERT
jgi:hypothetical protein